MTTPLISFEQVTFHWPSGTGGTGQTGQTGQTGGAGGAGIADASFSIAAGECVMVCGPSGAGKSTLLRLMVRFEEPQTGVIRFQGTPLAELDPMHLRRSVALLQQTPVMGGATVRDALLLPYTFASAHDMPRPSDATLLDRLQAVRLSEVRLDHTADGLSVGQKQRLALARVFGLRPAALLLDEPTSALDAENRQVVEQLIAQAHSDGIALVLVTHTDYLPPFPYRMLTVNNGTIRDNGQITPDASQHNAPAANSASPAVGDVRDTSGEYPMEDA